MTIPTPDDPPPPAGEPTPVDDAAAPPLSVAPGPAGLFELAVAVVTSPGRAVAEITQRAPLAWSIIVVLTVNALTAATQVANATDSLSAGASTATFGAVPLALSTPASLLIGVLLGAPVGLAVTAVWTAIVLVFARMLGGTGGYRVTFCGLAFASVPQILSVILTTVLLPLGTAGTVLGMVAALGIGAWTLVLSVMTVRHAHALSTGRAVAAVLLPIVAVLVVIALIVVAVIGLVIGTLA